MSEISNVLIKNVMHYTCFYLPPKKDLVATPKTYILSEIFEKQKIWKLVFLKHWINM